MAEPTDEETKAGHAIDALDALADQWALEINLPFMVKAMASPMKLNNTCPADVKLGFQNRMEAQIDAMIRQAFVEGMLRGIDGVPVKTQT
jgi:hypothetical protein